jgi:hypothetical protein
MSLTDNPKNLTTPMKTDNTSKSNRFDRTIPNYTIIGQIKNEWPGTYWIEESKKQFLSIEELDNLYNENLFKIEKIMKEIPQLDVLIENEKKEKEKKELQKQKYDFLNTILHLGASGAISRALKYKEQIPIVLYEETREEKKTEHTLPIDNPSQDENIPSNPSLIETLKEGMIIFKTSNIENYYEEKKELSENISMSTNGCHVDFPFLPQLATPLFATKLIMKYNQQPGEYLQGKRRLEKYVAPQKRKEKEEMVTDFELELIKRGITIHTAISFEEVKYFINNFVSSNLKDKHGRNPLHYIKEVEAVQLLIEAGCDVNSQDEKGYTPLHCQFNYEVAELLLKANANPNIENDNGNIPIHLEKDKKYIQVLLNCGSDLEYCNGDGKKPVEVNSILKELLIVNKQ